MPDWLRDALTDRGPPTDAEAVTRVVLGLLAGFVVAGVYVVGLGRKRGDAATLPTTLVLLTVVIAIVTMVIGENLARAFGLVGALSIVRFRTVVEDTRDTAFVIFAVVIGMAIGAGYSLLAALGFPAVLVAAVLMRHVGTRPPIDPAAATLIVRIGLGLDPDSLLGTTLAQHLSQFNLIGTGTARQGAALELTYDCRLRDPDKAFALVAELNRFEGVQGVELRRA